MMGFVNDFVLGLMESATDDLEHDDRDRDVEFVGEDCDDAAKPSLSLGFLEYEDGWAEIDEDDNSPVRSCPAAQQILSNALFAAVDRFEPEPMEDQDEAELVEDAAAPICAASAAQAQQILADVLMGAVEQLEPTESLEEAGDDADSVASVLGSPLSSTTCTWQPSQADIDLAQRLHATELARRRLENTAPAAIEVVHEYAHAETEAWQQAMDDAADFIDEVFDDVVGDLASQQVCQEECWKREATNLLAASEIDAMLTSCVQDFCRTKALDFQTRQQPLAEEELNAFWDQHEIVDVDAETLRERIAKPEAEDNTSEADIIAAAVAAADAAVAAWAAESAAATDAREVTEASTKKKKRRGTGRAARAAAPLEMHRIDTDEGKTTCRESSLTRAYEGLGAQIFSMDNDEKVFPPAWSRPLAPLAPSSRAVPSRQKSMSALAMDLGLESASSSLAPARADKPSTLKVSKSAGMLPSLVVAAPGRASAASSFSLLPGFSSKAGAIDRATKFHVLEMNLWEPISRRHQSDMGVF